MRKDKSRLVIALASLGLLFTLLGCGSSKEGKLYPVSGKITLNGTALTAGAIAFHSDADKGNKSGITAAGSIGSDGTYSVSTNGKSGAPAGWYKVTVTTNFPGVSGTPVPINAKYNAPTTSGLTCEVVPNASAGAYDFTVTK